MVRRIYLYKNYFLDFYKDQNDKEQEKIDFVIDLIRFERHVPNKFLKVLKNTDNIYEIRVRTTFKTFRILCFFDQEDLMVLLNCFLKKTQKTSRREIKLAEKLKKEYMSNKYSRDE